MTADPADWSKPTLVQVQGIQVQGIQAQGLDEAVEPESQQQTDGQAELEFDLPTAALPEPEPEPEPTRSVFFPRLPVARHPRAVYTAGTQPEWVDKLTERVADVALLAMPIPLRVLDVGCGTGRLLTEVILRVASAELYLGVDPRPDAVPADVLATEPRLSVVRAAAEALPLPDASFDLVLVQLSLTLWIDQRAGAAELARVVSRDGKVVVVEAKKPQLSGRNRVHNAKEITRLLESAGLHVEQVETVHRSSMQVSAAQAFIASP